MGKEENAGYQHFLLFPQCFQKASFSGLEKSGLCGKELKHGLFWDELIYFSNSISRQYKEGSIFIFQGRDVFSVSKSRRYKKGNVFS